jgi:hypothetical protein
MSPWPRHDLPAMPGDIALAVTYGPNLDWPKIPQDYEATLVRREAAAWPMRPALRPSLARPATLRPAIARPTTVRPATIRPVAAKPHAPAKPVRPRMAASALP